MSVELAFAAPRLPLRATLPVGGLRSASGGGAGNVGDRPGAAVGRSGSRGLGAVAG